MAIKLPEFQDLVNVQYYFENGLSMHYYSYLMQHGALFFTSTTDDIHPTQHPQKSLILKKHHLCILQDLICDFILCFSSFLVFILSYSSVFLFFYFPFCFLFILLFSLSRCFNIAIVCFCVFSFFLFFSFFFFFFSRRKVARGDRSTFHFVCCFLFFFRF